MSRSAVLERRETTVGISDRGRRRVMEMAELVDRITPERARRFLADWNLGLVDVPGLNDQIAECIDNLVVPMLERRSIGLPAL